MPTGLLGFNDAVNGMEAHGLRRPANRIVDSTSQALCFSEPIIVDFALLTSTRLPRVPWMKWMKGGLTNQPQVTCGPAPASSIPSSGPPAGGPWVVMSVEQGLRH